MRGALAIGLAQPVFCVADCAIYSSRYLYLHMQSFGRSLKPVRAPRDSRSMTKQEIPIYVILPPLVVSAGQQVRGIPHQIAVSAFKS